ncbi:unnamed protein product, partial [Durusdinium trenchii]
MSAADLTARSPATKRLRSSDLGGVSGLRIAFLHQQGRSLRGASSNVWLVESSDEDNGVDGDDDEAVRYLPKSHDGAQTTSMHAPDGRRVCLQDSVDETEDQWT